MKSFKVIIALTLTLVLGSITMAQTVVKSSSVVKTESFSVGGNCEMCKARIEKAAKVTGVTKAVWDVKTKKLTLTYNPATVKVLTVQKAVAAVGHDAGSVKADGNVYNKLPSCCKYR
jgi:copper chaperone CopZ